MKKFEALREVLSKTEELLEDCGADVCAIYVEKDHYVVKADKRGFCGQLATVTFNFDPEIRPCPKCGAACVIDESRLGVTCSSPNCSYISVEMSTEKEAIDVHNKTAEAVEKILCRRKV